MCVAFSAASMPKPARAPRSNPWSCWSASGLTNTPNTTPPCRTWTRPCATWPRPTRTPKTLSCTCPCTCRSASSAASTNRGASAKRWSCSRTGSTRCTMPTTRPWSAWAAWSMRASAQAACLMDRPTSTVCSATPHGTETQPTNSKRPAERAFSLESRQAISGTWTGEWSSFRQAGCRCNWTGL